MAKAAAAGWGPHPNLTAASRELTWRYPDLHLRVWALPDGVHILAYIQRQGATGQVQTTEVARAVFMPREVTEVGVVDWGRRALAHWLEDQELPTVEQ
jgi:hypothetical protein